MTSASKAGLLPGSRPPAKRRGDNRRSVACTLLACGYNVRGYCTDPNLYGISREEILDAGEKRLCYRAPKEGHADKEDL